MGRGSYGTQIIPENATDTPNLSSLLSVEDTEARPLLGSWKPILEDHVRKRELYEDTNMGTDCYFHTDGSVQILSLKVIEQNTLFLFNIKIHTHAHPEMAGRMDF